jgi:hypothetical protein
MKKILYAVIAGSAASLACAAFAQTGLDLKGKMKEGQYETSFKMEIPGLPAGMGGINNTSRSCVTKEDIEKGKGEMFRDPKNAKRESSCEIKNVKNSGNSISYDMDCPKEGMTSTTTMVFADNGVKGLTKMKMSGEKAAKMPAGMGDMQMQFESKYLGPTCAK